MEYLTPAHTHTSCNRAPLGRDCAPFEAGDLAPRNVASKALRAVKWQLRCTLSRHARTPIVQLLQLQQIRACTTVPCGSTNRATVFALACTRARRHAVPAAHHPQHAPRTVMSFMRRIVSARATGDMTDASAARGTIRSISRIASPPRAPPQRRRTRGPRHEQQRARRHRRHLHRPGRHQRHALTHGAVPPECRFQRVAHLRHVDRAP